MDGIALDLAELAERGCAIIGCQEQSDTAPFEVCPVGWVAFRPKKAQSAALYWHPGLVDVRSYGYFKTSSEGDPIAPREIVWAQLADGRRFGTTHLPHNKDDPAHGKEHEYQAARCAEWLAAGRRVLLGDFNANPDSKWMRALREVARYHEPVEPGTGPPGGNPIDHVWASDDLPRPRRTGTLKGVSDHDALLAEV